MPLIGSSSIFGSGKGPTGNTGPIGAIGSIGYAGTTKGNTGSTGTHITRVISNRENNTITFYTSDENYYTLSGFTGPSSFVYGADGVSAAFDANYTSIFAGISNGLTLNYFGISAGNNVSITTNDSQIVVNLTSAGGGYVQTPNTNYIPFTDNPYLRSSNIFVDASDILNFGLTGIPTGVTSNLLYTFLQEDVNYVQSNIPNSNGGMVLDLRQNSNHWIETPIGITAFTGISLAGIRQEYTLFINGSQVWNLPKNLYLENTDQGILNYAFLDGVNILHIWSDNAGITFNGIFVDRAFGITGPFSFSNIGSCCYKKYGYSYCRDGVSSEICKTLNGSFQAFTNCYSRVGIDDCGTTDRHNVIGQTGACCCGITGCLDNSPESIDPATVVMTRNVCENIIGGKFYPNKQCRTGDRWASYSVRTVDGNTASNILCHKDCIDPVACYRIVNNVGICSLETVGYCNEIGGTPFINKTCSEINQIGGGSELIREGWCNKFGVWSDLPNVKKYECTPCGYWNETAPVFNAVFPVSKLVITTPNPLIKIVHSIGLTGDFDNDNVTTSYSDRDSTANFLTFQLSQETTQKHTLYGVVKLLDEGLVGQTVFNIWDLRPQDNECFGINVFDEDGLTLTENSFIEKDRRYFLEIKGKPSRCLQLYSDRDFKAEIYLGLNSCVGGFTLGSKSDTVPIIYTRSPCSCIAIDRSTIKGDVLNKAPLTIPFSAERFCLDCTNSYIGISGDASFYTHIPYPLKRQSGIITFCPPTENFQDNPISICTNPEAFCISYGRIEELSGCTYSSLFDANNDRKLFDGYNTAFSDCYHAEYNVPGEGTTYFYSGLGNQNIRSCQTKCKIRMHYGSSIDELTNRDCSSVDCTNTPSSSCCSGSFSTNLNLCKTCAGNNASITGPCDFSYYEPYFNRVYLDTNSLYEIGQKYNIDIDQLEKNIISTIRRKKLLFDPNFIGVNTSNPYGVTTADSNVGGATIERVVQGITLNPNPDDRAKASCLNCKEFFDLSKKIRIPKTPTVQTYDVYGLLLQKENACTSVENKTNPKQFDEQDTDKKYYILLKKSDNSCYLIYDIGTQSIINSPIRNLTDKFFDYDTSCSLNCENYKTKIKQVKWFGTVDSPASYSSPSTTDLCQESFILNYTIKKYLNENNYIFETITEYKLEDIINFSGLNYNSSIELSKTKELSSLLLSIFNGTLDDHKQKQCAICTNDECYSDLVQNMSEFIGASCFVDGISGSVADSEFYSSVFDFQPDLIKVPYTSTQYKDISAGFYCTVGITAGGVGISGGLTGWGKNHFNMMDGFQGNTYIKVSAGPNCICAISGYTYTNVGGGASTPIIQIDSGVAHTVAILNSGGVTCWGDDTYGQVSGMPAGLTANYINCGDYHTCAIQNNKIICWGRNTDGQCNVPSNFNLSVAKWSKVSAGLSYSAALGNYNGGSLYLVYLWGNTAGFKNDPKVKWDTFDGYNLVVNSAGGIAIPSTDISCGSNHIIINSSLGLTAFGDNTEKQLDFSTTTNRIWSGTSVPNITTNNAITKVSAKGNRSMAYLSMNNNTEKSVLIWGTNKPTSFGTGFKDTTDISCGYDHYFIRRGNNILYGLGSDTYKQISGVPSSINFSSSIDDYFSTGKYFTCSYDTLNGLTCWGLNDKNQCKSPGSTPTSTVVYNTNLICRGAANQNGIIYPNTNPIIAGIKDIAVGYAHTAWIDSSDGISFISSTTNPFYTASVGMRNALKNIKAKSISSGKYHSCAILNDDGITCWGDNYFEQCNIPSGLTASKISCGGHHTIALLGNGSIRAWGATAFGLGNVPTGTYKEISAGYIHNCGIKTDGSIGCWGYSYDGQLNSPKTGSYTKISAGREHTVALDASGGITCWGVIGDDGICASFEDKTLIKHDNNKLWWLKEGKPLTASELFSSKITTSTLYFNPYNQYPPGLSFDTFDGKFFRDIIVGALYVSNGKIKQLKETIIPLSKDINFYYLYNYPKSADTSSLSFYDVLYNDTGRINENKGFIIRKRMPRFDVNYFRDKISLSNVKTYIIINSTPSRLTYQPIITFNLKTRNVIDHIFANIYKIGASDSLTLLNEYYNINQDDAPISIGLQSSLGLDLDDNKYAIVGQPTTEKTHISLKFSDKYLLVYSRNYIKSSPYYGSINAYPGITYGFNSIKTLLDNTVTLNTVHDFDLKPLPTEQTDCATCFTVNDTANTDRKNIDGYCLEFDCSKMPEFCSGYPSC